MSDSIKKAHTVSMIYKHIWLYRVMMNILYCSGYKKRFVPVIQIIERIKPKSVLELCFGDTAIADHCRSQGIQWQGIDSNEYFVRRAVRRGFGAQCIDLLGPAALPQTDLVIIVGSLYHFHGNINRLFSMMIQSSPSIIISEPIINISNQNNWLGWLARKSSNAGHGEEAFRYTGSSLLQMLEVQGRLLKFSSKIIGYYKKDCIILVTKTQA